jgi:hypothetical protein
MHREIETGNLLWTKQRIRGNAHLVKESS